MRPIRRVQTRWDGRDGHCTEAPHASPSFSASASLMFLVLAEGCRPSGYRHAPTARARVDVRTLPASRCHPQKVLVVEQDSGTDGRGSSSVRVRSVDGEQVGGGLEDVVLLEDLCPSSSDTCVSQFSSWSAVKSERTACKQTHLRATLCGSCLRA